MYQLNLIKIRGDSVFYLPCKVCSNLSEGTFIELWKSEKENQNKQVRLAVCWKFSERFSIDSSLCDYAPDEFASYDFLNEKQTSNQRSNQSNYWVI